MGISSIRIDYESIEAFCPICKNNFTGWYCPSCGLPKKNSKYTLSKYGSLDNCGQYHFRPEFSSFENIQLCDKCYTTNPSNAKYCRNCGKKFTSSKGISKDAHGWVDLGLSVLWATETIEGLYIWNNTVKLYHTTDTDDMDFYRKQEAKEVNDVATQKWGERWRTPTKEEFEELVIKCKWEKCLHPISNKHALKVTGPNGNSITIPVTGYAGCNQKEKQGCFISYPRGNPEAEHSVCALWTSSEYKTEPHRRAYAFYFRGYEGFITKTLTAKEKKEQEFKNNRDHREFESMFEPIERDYYWWKPGISEKRLQIMKKRWQIERQKEEEERQILRNMGDDSQERADNIKKDEERRRSLWLDTPIEMHYNEERIPRNTIRPMGKDNGFAILPVTDKKWQGCL